MESKKTVYDYITDALEQLHTVRAAMLDAMLLSQQDPDSSKWMTSDEFEPLNALADRLDSLSARYAPAYKPFSWSEFIATADGNSKEGEKSNECNC